MIDIDKLKQAALAATQSTWVYDQRSSAIVTITKYEVKAVADFGACSLPECDANATFIATSNPSAVLELITRLEELQELYASSAFNTNYWKGKAEAAESQLGTIEALERQLAELKPFADVGKDMVEITTTVQGVDEWGAIPTLWKMCVEERDKAIKKLAEKDAEIGRLKSTAVGLHYTYEQVVHMQRDFYTQFAAQELVIHQLRDALEKITQFASVQICSHDETYRGGNIWEICSQCGAKWADDEGGKPEFVEPKQITEGIQALTIPTSTEYLEAWYKEMVGEPVGHFYETAEHSYNQCWPSDAEAMPFHAIKPFPFKGNADDKPF